MGRKRTTEIVALDEHPNLPEILGVLAQLAHVSDADLPRLAKAWHNTVFLAYARPVLSRTEHSALMAAWRAVYPIDLVEEPDLGDRANEIKHLLSAMPQLAVRCHDADAASRFEAIVDISWVLDEDVRSVARQE